MDTNLFVRKKDKGYQYVISYKDGRRWRQLSRQGFRTAAEAKRAGQEKEREIQDAIPLVKADTTFREVAAMVEQDGLKSANTIKSYKYWIIPYEDILDKPIQDITYPDISKAVFDYQKTHRYSSVKSVAKHGSRIMEFARKKLKLITHNPFDGLSIISPRQSDKYPKRALTPHEIEVLLDGLKGHIKVMTAIMALCGLRIGEVRGLTRRDIKDGMISVNHQRLQNKERADLKTARSHRMVPIPRTVQEILNGYPMPMDPDEYIFPFTSSDHLRPKYERAGFSVSAHELRHSYATNCLSAGIDFKTVAALIGDSVEMVYKVYSHVNADMMERAAKILKDF